MKDTWYICLLLYKSYTNGRLYEICVMYEALYVLGIYRHDVMSRKVRLS